MSQLKELFPMLREREEIVEEINGNPYLSRVFRSWDKEQRDRFLDICTGARGVRILNDPFFKEIMNPEYIPGRMEGFLTHVLRQKIKILQVLPNDSVRIASEGTLLVTDVIVELEDGSIVNVEVQRIGYKFPGQRAACYSADMLLRQYKRVREVRGKKFVYKDVKPVYTIVLFEKSASEFRNFPGAYIHYLEAKSDTGIEVDLLQKYVFISLDSFRKRSDNEIIKDSLEAWLTFFSEEEPEKIEKLIRIYPEFKLMYDDIYNTCLNTERVMEMFSKELQMIDENTVQYMIDELQIEVDELNAEILEKKRLIAEQELALEKTDKELAETDRKLAETDRKLAETDRKLAEKDKELTEKDKELTEKDKELTEKNQELAKQRELIHKLQEELEELHK